VRAEAPRAARKRDRGGQSRPQRLNGKSEQVLSEWNHFLAVIQDDTAHKFLLQLLRESDDCSEG